MHRKKCILQFISFGHDVEIFTTSKESIAFTYINIKGLFALGHFKSVFVYKWDLK